MLVTSEGRMNDRALTPETTLSAGARAQGKRGYPDGTSGLQLLLYALQSPINIGMILRVAETYRFDVAIYDRHGVLDDPDKLNTVKDFACGAAMRRPWQEIADEAGVERLLAGRRLVSTSIDSRSCPLPEHPFVRGDVIALGNEYDGLPDGMIARAGSILHIPMPPGWAPKPKALRPIDPTRSGVARDGQPNLNVAMAAAIICYTAFNQPA
jgi:tRNA G18 (ribose-2'-O)-methylase SpoU